MAGKRSTASAAPATIDSGRPTPSRRPVSGRSCRAAARGTPDASANSSRASVISARTCTSESSTSTVTRPQRGLATTSPATRKTSGPVRLRAAKRAESSDQPNTTIDSAMRVGAFTAGHPHRRRRWTVAHRPRSRAPSRRSAVHDPGGRPGRHPRRDDPPAGGSCSDGCAARSRTSRSSRPSSSMRAKTSCSASREHRTHVTPVAGLQVAVGEGGAQRRAGHPLERHLVGQISHRPGSPFSKSSSWSRPTTTSSPAAG